MRRTLLASLLLIAILLTLCACGKADQKAAETPAPTATAEPTPPPPEKLIVFHNCAETDAALQAVAQAYTAQSGVEVELRGAAGEAYAQALREALDAEAAPALFVLEAAGTEDLSDKALTLTEAELSTLKDRQRGRLCDINGAVKGIGFTREAFGLLVNTELLTTAGFKFEELNGFGALRGMSESIQLRADELKFGAFTVFGFWEEDVPRASAYVLNIPLFYEFRDGGVTETPERVAGSYLPYLRNLWDMQVWGAIQRGNVWTNYTEDEALDAFIEGKAVFSPQGSWVCDTLAEKMDLSQVRMIPLYCGMPGEEELGLSVGCRDFWAVNAGASSEQQRMALDFLAELAESLQAQEENPFLAEADRLAAEGKYNVDWVFPLTPNAQAWRRTMSGALARYSMDFMGDNWPEFSSTFVDAWALEYALSGRG